MQIKKILLPVLGLAMLLGGCSKQNTNNITISNDSSVIGGNKQPESEKLIKAAFAWEEVDDTKVLSDFNTLYITHEAYEEIPGFNCYELWGVTNIDHIHTNASKIAIDYEPYQNEDWKENIGKYLTAYIDFLENYDGEAIIVIPSWWSRDKYKEYLEKIVEYSDGVVIMAYQVGNEYEISKEEIELCKKYGKSFVVGYEIQPLKEGMDENSTYNKDLNAVYKNFHDQFDEVENVNGYAIHYYRYIKEILS